VDVGPKQARGQCGFCAPDQGFLTRPAWEDPRLPDKPPLPVLSRSEDTGFAERRKHTNSHLRPLSTNSHLRPLSTNSHLRPLSTNSHLRPLSDPFPFPFSTPFDPGRICLVDPTEHRGGNNCLIGETIPTPQRAFAAVQTQMQRPVAVFGDQGAVTADLKFSSVTERLVIGRKVYSTYPR
jgi:hypothetical protein